MSSDRPMSYSIKEGAATTLIRPGPGSSLAVPAATAPTQVAPTRMPECSLVQAIKDEFRDIAANSGVGSSRGFGDDHEFSSADARNMRVSAEDIARYWEALADAELYSRGRSMISVGIRAKQAIALRVAQLMQDMDLMKAGQVGMDEWTHFMLMSRSGFAARQVNSLLDKALQRNRTILHELQRMFDAADRTKCGTLEFPEIVSMYAQKLWHLRPSSLGPVKQMTDEELGAGSPEEFAREVLQAMDINGDERVSYAEFMAYSLGRRKHEVLLHLYDLSNGAAKQVSPWLIGKELEGVWHTGVVVYGKEYYYSKDTVYADAGDTSFGKPTRIVHLGYTLWRQDELHEFVTTELKPVFQRDTYDVICNNCNHFSDRVCMFLVGKHPPPEVMQQPELLLRARSVRVIRPILNWWLRDRIVVRETGVALPPGVQRLKPGDNPPMGTIVTIHAAQGCGQSILGQVTASPERSDSECGPGLAAGCDASPWAVGCAVLAAPSDSCAPSAGFEQSGCGGLWAGTCGAIKAAGHAVAGGGSVGGVWVQYFDISLGATSSAVGRAQVKVELIPHSRISVGGLREGDGEELFRRALRAIADAVDGGGSSRRTNGALGGRATGRGAAPIRVPVPNSMSLETDNRLMTSVGVAISQL